MRFISKTHGSIGEPVPGIDADALRLFLPARLRKHPMAEDFLAATIEQVETFAGMGEDDPEVPPAHTRDALNTAEQAAHALQNALAPMAGGSDAFDALEAQFRYLRIRAQENDMPTEGRPKVPGLPRDLPALRELLQRIADDLGTLRTVCDYTAALITPTRSAPRTRERMLVRLIAESYRQCFGALPPKRSWFANDLCAYIGSSVGADLGHRVVGEAVESLR